MPVAHGWLNDKIILSQKFDGHVTGKDLDGAVHETMEMLGDEGIYLLFDFYEAALLPERIFELASISQLLSHGSVRWLAIVSPDGYDSRTTRLLARGKVKVFESVTMAHAFLKGMYRIDTGEILE